MADRAVARRYAEAFVNALEASGRSSGGASAGLGAGPSTELGAGPSTELGAGLEELRLVAQVYSDSRDLKRFLGSPEIGTEEKERLLNRLLSDAVGGQTLALLHLLMRWDRVEHLPAILQEAQSAAEERQGVLRGWVVTAHPISAAETEALARAVEKSLGGKRVILERRVSPQLLGGAQVTVGSTLLDGSVRGFLEGVRQQLKAVKVN